MMDAREKKPPRVLVCIASFGTGNDAYLERLIQEFRSMSLNTRIVVHSNIAKELDPDIEVVVGLPTKNPRSLPFAHKRYFAERKDAYDLFVYTEDDILISEQSLRAFLDVTCALPDDEIAGFLRSEDASDGSLSYPDIHAHFHWDPRSVRTRGSYTLAHLSNEHSGCYALTRAQLAKAIASGGYLVAPHEWKYDLLETGATDPYTQCGFRKLIPISHLGAFTVRHLPNKYVGKLGIAEAELRAQVERLLRLAQSDAVAAPLLQTETNLRKGLYSKSYHEPVDEALLAAIPSTARNVLSIGCGSAATERRLAERGVRVVAVPLDPVVAGGKDGEGVEMVVADLESALARLKQDRFDCIVCSDVLHLVRDPDRLLSLVGGLLDAQSTMVFRSPNMLSLSTLRVCLRDPENVGMLRRFDRAGAHFVSPRSARAWCRRAGLEMHTVVRLLPRQARQFQALVPEFVRSFLAPDFIAVARKAPETARTSE